MTITPPRADLGTHEVSNQPAPRGARDLWTGDTALRMAVQRAGGRIDDLAHAGATYGSDAMLGAAEEARRDKPRLMLFARSGHRLDEVRFIDGYHQVI